MEDSSYFSPRPRGKVSELNNLARDIVTWLATQPVILDRFLALTGIDPLQLRAIADEPAFAMGVVEFLLGHEPDLLAYCAHSGYDPATIVALHHAMAAPKRNGDGS